MQWLWVLLMIGQSLANLECDVGFYGYYPSDKAKCRAPEFDDVFNNGADLMGSCYDGWVSKLQIE